MLKGVNRKIVEVTDMEHEYFEKAILIVKENKGERGELLLRQEANQYLKGLRYRPGKQKRMHRWGLGALKLGGAVALGATLMSLVKF